MPILIPANYPAYDVLREKNVFVMNSDRASIQDIRPLKIGVINLMPTLEVTETQLIKMLANTPLQVDLHLIMMDTDYRKKEDLSHLNQFYKPYREVKDEKFDGMIITGAPVEKLAFEEVDYWDDLKQLMDDLEEKCVQHDSYLLGGAGGPVLSLQHRKDGAGPQDFRHLSS